MCKSPDGLASVFSVATSTTSKPPHEINYSVFVRHLFCERDEGFLSAMEKFIKTVVGNNYNISLKNLLFRKKSLKGGTEKEIEQREFFCSELIAKAFKECGLLTTEQACCQFLPADFSSREKKLKLQNGAKLGEELMIMFDEEDIKTKRLALEKEE